MWQGRCAPLPLFICCLGLEKIEIVHRGNQIANVSSLLPDGSVGMQAIDNLFVKAFADAFFYLPNVLDFDECSRIGSSSHGHRRSIDDENLSEVDWLVQLADDLGGNKKKSIFFFFSFFFGFVYLSEWEANQFGELVKKVGFLLFREMGVRCYFDDGHSFLNQRKKKNEKIWRNKFLIIELVLTRLRASGSRSLKARIKCTLQ